MKILIGYDGSECADAALDDLTHAGLPPDAEAHILSVGEVWLPPPPPSSYEIIEQAREAKSQAELQRNFAKGCSAARDALLWLNAHESECKLTFPTGRLRPIHHVARLPGSWFQRQINGSQI